ncbi:nuclear transport factor 2 family protein [Pleomorphomonas sp. PLEO]|uniref:nuclear transport factor 2 family protein n=1 Tax=Pleomorphomonas sp. PLEO TaxID=3239306 RepID=UPI00351F4264
MTLSPDVLPTFSAMLRSAIGDLLEPSAGSFLEMFAEDGVMEFPYAPPGSVKVLHGRSALADHLKRFPEILSIDGFSVPQVWRTDTPGTVILEMECKGRGIRTGEPYDQTYISVVTTKDGRIQRYKDYWNPLVVLRAIGGSDALKQVMGESNHA